MNLTENSKTELLTKLDRIDIILSSLCGNGSRWDDDRADEGSQLIKQITEVIKELDNDIILEKWEIPCIVLMSDFVNSIKHGMGVDGNGYYSNGVTRTNKPISLSNIDTTYTHVVWYDK